jgi:uncharacterized protein
VLPILGALFALSLAAGFVGALSGLGGAFFIVPALVILAHVPMYVAIGASLISVVATSAGASVAFVRDGWTNLHIAMVLECATVTGALKVRDWRIGHAKSCNRRQKQSHRIASGEVL